MGKTCENCGNYYLYYTKSYNHFNKTKQGICNAQHAQKTKTDTCDKWQSEESRTAARERVCLKTLNDAINSINELTQILRENDLAQ